MRLDKIKRRTWLSWACVALLVILCTILASLQYRWIGKVADAENGRLREELQSRLRLLRRNFDDQISSTCASFVPSTAQIENMARESPRTGMADSRAEPRLPPQYASPGDAQPLPGRHWKGRLRCGSSGPAESFGAGLPVAIG